MITRLLLAIGCFVALTLASCEESGPPPSCVPPPGATILDPDVTPEMVLIGVVKKGVGAPMTDVWIPEPGWFGTIDRLSEEHGRTVAWIKYPSSPIIGGSFLIGVDIVEAGGRDLSSVRQIEFTGRIEKAECAMVGPIPECKIVVRNAKILKADGK